MGLEDIKSSLDIMIAQVMKASSSMTGLDLSVSGIINRLNNLHSSFLNLSITTGTSGKSMEALENRIMSMSSAFGYTQENMAKMQQTLMVGFREPIRDAETFNALLVKSQSLFGSNEESAQQFINSLAALSNKNTGLRDSMLELMVLQGKSAQSGQSLNAGEIKQKELLKNYNKEQLSFMLLTGDISKEQYNTNMKLMQETSVSADAYEARYTRMQTVLQSMKAPGIAGTAALNDLSQNEMLSAGIGKVMTFGADVVAGSIEKVRGLKRARDYQENQPDLGTEESKLAVDVAMEDIKGLGITDPALIEKSAKATWEMLGYTKDQAEALSKSAEFQKSMGSELGINMARQSQINKLVEGTLSIEEQRNIVMQEQAAIMEQMRMSASSYKNAITLSLGAFETMAAAAGRAGQAFNINGAGFDAKEILSNTESQIFALNKIADVLESKAASLRSAQEALDSGDDSKTSKRLDLLIEGANNSIKIYQEIINTKGGQSPAKESAATSLEEQLKVLKELEEAKKTGDFSNIKNVVRSEDASTAEAIAKVNAQKAEQFKVLQGVTNGLLSIAVAAENERLSILQAQGSVLQSEVALMDSLAVGIGANAAAREKVALNTMQQAKLEEQKIKNLQEQRVAFSDLANNANTEAERINAIGALNDVDKKINEATAKRNSLQKDALDQLQKLREGYLDSIDAMQSGAGIFTELIVSQDKSLGALIRTTQEVPRVLRTGAGSGGITSATQFGPGGLSGSFDPKSEEYSKHVLTNISQINDLVSSLPEQIGKSVGTNLALAAKGRSEYDGQLMGAASPGTSGVISSSSPSSIVGSNAATSLAAGTAPVATQVAVATKEAAEATASATAGTAPVATQVAVATKQAEEATTRAVGTAPAPSILTAPDVVMAKAEEALATKAADTAAKALEKATKALGAAEEAAAKAAAEAEAAANSAEAVATRAATSAGTASELGAALIAAEAAANKATEAAAVKVAEAAATAATAGTAGTAGTALAALTALAAAEAEAANKAAEAAAAKVTEVATAKAAVAVAATVATNATAEAEAANKAAAAATKAAAEATARAVGAAGSPAAPPAPAAPVGNKATVEAAAEVAVATKQAAEATTKAVGAAPVAAPPPAPAILAAPDVVIAKAEEALATKAADTAAKALEKATKALGAAEEAAAEAEAVANSAVAVATRAATSAGTASGLGAALIAATLAAAAEAEAAAKATEVATAKEVVAAKAAEVVAAKAAEVVTAKEVVAAKTTTEAATRAAEAAAANKAVVASGDISYNQQQRMQAEERAAESVATNAAGASVPFQSSTINGVTVSTSEMVSQISKIIQDGMIQAVQIGTRSAIAELSNAAASSR